jgi:hypothetical protein
MLVLRARVSLEKHDSPSGDNALEYPPYGDTTLLHGYELERFHRVHRSERFPLKRRISEIAKPNFEVHRIGSGRAHERGREVQTHEPAPCAEDPEPATVSATEIANQARSRQPPIDQFHTPALERLNSFAGPPCDTDGGYADPGIPGA